MSDPEEATARGLEIHLGRIRGLGHKLETALTDLEEEFNRQLKTEPFNLEMALLALAVTRNYNHVLHSRDALFYKYWDTLEALSEKEAKIWRERYWALGW